MTNSLKQRIQDDMKAAMRAKEKEKLATIRLILSAVKQIEVDERVDVDDVRLIAILNKMVKQRVDSIEQFTSGGRDDLVAGEQAQLDIIKTYLPEPLSDNEVDDIIKQAISDAGAESAKDMGKVMGLVKAKVDGRADLKAVSAKVKDLLAG